MSHPARYYLVVMVLFLSFFSCSKEEPLAPRPYPMVETYAGTKSGIEFTLHAEITYVGEGIDDYGFVWSYGSDPKKASNPESVSFGEWDGSSKSFSHLFPHKYHIGQAWYVTRAYVRRGGFTFYGDPIDIKV